MKIGAQFYTIRQSCQTLEGLAESMQRVADIGYKHIQLSGVCPYEADWMAEKLKETGLSCEITHYSYDKIMNQTAETIDFHDTIGSRCIGIGVNPRGVTPEGLAAMERELRSAMRQIAASGHQFMYHNHHMEFARFDAFGGKTFMEQLCETFTPEECGITLDTYWVQAGGADPAAWLRALKGRVPCVHFKDMVFSHTDNAVRMAAVGKGNMNYPAMISACEDAGVEYVLVEQDNCYDEDPFDCLKQSYEYLRAQGLE